MSRRTPNRRAVDLAVRRLAVLAVAVSMVSCSASDDGDDDDVTVEDDDLTVACQPAHGDAGHDHDEHVTGLPTCP